MGGKCVIRICNVESRLLSTPLKNAFITSRDIEPRSFAHRVEIKLYLTDGTSGVGEVVPVSYVTGETLESVQRDIEVCSEAIAGMEATTPVSVMAGLAPLLTHSPSTLAGLEIALYDLCCKINGITLWSHLGGAIKRVTTDLTLSITPEAPEIAQQAAISGFKIFKMKVGGSDPGQDLARILAVHRAVPEAVIRLDANQAYTASQALRFIDIVVKAGVNLELVEQPVAWDDLSALDEVAKNSSVPIVADESVKSPADALRVLSETSVHGINIKLMKSGLNGALDIITLARLAGRQLMLGCMLESRRGISSSLALACGTGAFTWIDLDGHLLLDEPGENGFFREEGPNLNIVPSLPNSNC